jgi:solute carrier family 25 folate transporter 32
MSHVDDVSNSCLNQNMKPLLPKQQLLFPRGHRRRRLSSMVVHSHQYLYSNHSLHARTNIMSESKTLHTPASRAATAPLIAGLAGGTVSTILLFPLDIIKVRLQVHEGDPGTQKELVNKRTRLGTMRVVRGVIRHEGFAGLYQGLTPALIGSSVSWGGFFFVYEQFKSQLRQRRAASTGNEQYTLTPVDNFLLACSSGVVMVGLTNPVWLIKVRMQLQMKKASEHIQTTVKPYNGMIDAARTIVREEGFWALYKGSGPALLLTSHGGVQFVVYEFLRKHFHYARARRDDKSDGEMSSVMNRLEKSMGYLTMGAVAKVVASTVTYPLQVVKTRLQQRSEIVELTSDGEVRVVKREYPGIRAALKRILEKEGPTGFFKGCIPNAVRVAPSAAVTFLVYEAVMDVLSP